MHCKVCVFKEAFAIKNRDKIKAVAFLERRNLSPENEHPHNISKLRSLQTENNPVPAISILILPLFPSGPLSPVSIKPPQHAGQEQYLVVFFAGVRILAILPNLLLLHGF